jgi:hypothetical protein
MRYLIPLLLLTACGDDADEGPPTCTAYVLYSEDQTIFMHFAECVITHDPADDPWICEFRGELFMCEDVD